MDMGVLTSLTTDMLLLREVKDVALLRSNNAIRGGDGFHAEEEVERAQVLDSKIILKGLQE